MPTLTSTRRPLRALVVVTTAVVSIAITPVGAGAASDDTGPLDHCPSLFETDNGMTLDWGPDLQPIGATINCSITDVMI